MELAMKMAARFLKEESGATAIEYGLIAFAMFFAILTLIQLIGVQLSDLLQALIDGYVIVQS